MKTAKGAGKGIKKSAPTFLATGPSGVMGRGPKSPDIKAPMKGKGKGK